ncbi:uncharacterized protein LOC144165860 [Haemaphysalis longicornis]
MYVDAAEYQESGRACAAAVVRASTGETITAASVRTQKAHRAEEVAIAVAIADPACTTVLCYSRTAIDVSDRGNINHNETAKAAARGLTNRAAAAEAEPSWWWREIKESMTTYTEIVKWYRQSRRKATLRHVRPEQRGSPGTSGNAYSSFVLVLSPSTSLLTRSHCVHRWKGSQFFPSVSAAGPSASGRTLQHGLPPSHRLFCCQQCSYVTPSSSSLKRHLRTHTGERPFQCSQCDKAFVTSGCLVNHVRTHTGERPFQCSQCDKAFVQSGHLVAHRRTHTGERPFQCSQCDQAFVKKYHLVTHRRTHTGERPFQCSQCDKAFVESGHLVAHRRTHTGERPFQCSQCDKAFVTSRCLVIHQRTHTGERPYHCYLCPMAFTQSSHLARHINSHTRETFWCRFCPQTFARQHQQETHEKKHKVRPQ